MSIRVNHYVLQGLSLPFDEAQKLMGHKPYELYYDTATGPIQHKNGLCVVVDGMNGDYFFIGRVLAKTQDHEGFDEPIEIPNVEFEDRWQISDAIFREFGIKDAKIKTYAFTHMR